MSLVNPIAADEELDFGWDWSRTLPPGDAVQSQQLIADPGVTVLSLSSEGNETAFFCRVSGSVNDEFNVRTRITSVGGRTLSRTHRIKLVEAKYA